MSLVRIQCGEESTSVGNTEAGGGPYVRKITLQVE